MINDISCEVRRRRWNWLGHILRKDGLRWTSEGGQEEDQKLYLEKDSRERAKQSWMEEPGSTSGCTKQKVLVRQRGSFMRLLARWDLMMMMMMMMMMIGIMITRACYLFSYVIMVIKIPLLKRVMMEPRSNYELSVLNLTRENETLLICIKTCFPYFSRSGVVW